MKRYPAVEYTWFLGPQVFFTREVAMSARAIGWDIHRKFSLVSVREVTTDGEVRTVERQRLAHADRETMTRWLEGQPKGTPVAMEAAFGWPWIADLLEALELEPHLAHPPAVRVLAKGHAKSDRCDSDRLADFQLQGILPESYLAPPQVRELRERVRYRMALACVRTGIKNRLQAVLHRQGILHSYSDLFGKAGRKFLQELVLSEASREVLSSYLRLLDQIEELLEEVEHWMEENLKTNRTVQLLESLPGIGKILAHVLEAEIGQIERFPSYRHLASYAGLAPVSDDSAARHGRRHCSPYCNHTLRWALVEAAAVVVGRCGSQASRLKALYHRITRGGREKKAEAIVAVAHELAKLVFIVWKNGQPYTATPPARPGSNQERKQQDHQTKRSVRSGQPVRPMVRPELAALGQTFR